MNDDAQGDHRHRQVHRHFAAGADQSMVELLRAGPVKALAATPTRTNLAAKRTDPSVDQRRRVIDRDASSVDRVLARGRIVECLRGARNLETFGMRESWNKFVRLDHISGGQRR